MRFRSLRLRALYQIACYLEIGNCRKVVTLKTRFVYLRISAGSRGDHNIPDFYIGTHWTAGTNADYFFYSIVHEQLISVDWNAWNSHSTAHHWDFLSFVFPRVSKHISDSIHLFDLSEVVFSDVLCSEGVSRH